MVQLSIITSVATKGVAPYKELLSHGFVMDGEGKKMSKSLGNVILPEKVMKQMGADIIRLWVMSSDFEEDVRISDDILKQVSEVYRKVRNTFRFLLGNVADFNPNEDAVAYEDMKEVDQFMMQRFNEMVNLMRDCYDRYDYVSMYQSLQNFINVDLSNFYLDYGKDILYIESADAHIRRSMQTVLYRILTDSTASSPLCSCIRPKRSTSIRLMWRRRASISNTFRKKRKSTLHWWKNGSTSWMSGMTY